ncbi:MAG TPA: cysteine dioxygenase family protein, partial [Candidatus Eisenbacteria bacterium]|nr:cysteine dioxygenase family protein [Candidatus Eisenbacteria bacterium]
TKAARTDFKGFDSLTKDVQGLDEYTLKPAAEWLLARTQQETFGARLAAAKPGELNVSAESRAYPSPWVRVVRGTAIGQNPIDYDPEMAKNLRAALAELDKKIPKGDAYNNFANELTELILSVNDPSVRLSAGEIRFRTDRIVAEIEEIADPYSFVTAVSVLLESFAKLGLDLSLLVNDRRDVVQNAFSALPGIPSETKDDKGTYERLTAYATLFHALGEAGMKDRINEGRDRVKESLDLIAGVPSAYYRGRGSSTLFTTLAGLGLTERATSGPVDYVKGVLDYMDQKLDRSDAKRLKTDLFHNVYPLFTMLNALSVIGKPEYLTYKRDWIAESNGFVQRMDVPPMHLLQYYLIALYNLGKLQENVPDLKEFIRNWSEKWARYPKTRLDALLYHMYSVYALETALYFGYTDLLRDDLVQRIMDTFLQYERYEPYRNAAYGGSYALTLMGEIGKADLLFKPSPDYDGEAPFLWSIRHYTGEIGSISMPYMHHAIIGYALRMRGAGKPDTDFTKGFRFLGARLAADQDTEVGRFANDHPDSRSENAIFHNTWTGAVWKMVNQSDGVLRRSSFLANRLSRAVANGNSGSREVQTTPRILLKFDSEQLAQLERQKKASWIPDQVNLIAGKDLPFWALKQESKKEVIGALERLSQADPATYPLNGPALTAILYPNRAEANELLQWDGAAGRRYDPAALLDFVADKLGYRANFDKDGLYAHTLLVMMNFERFKFSGRLPAIEGLNVLPLLRLALAFHDIGKPLGPQKDQYLNTIPIVRREMKKMGFEEREIAFVTSLIDGDPLGELLYKRPQGEPADVSISRAAGAIRQQAGKAQVEPSQFLEALTAYYISDAGAYGNAYNLFELRPEGMTIRPTVNLYYDLKTRFQVSLSDTVTIPLAAIRAAAAPSAAPVKAPAEASVGLQAARLAVPVSDALFSETVDAVIRQTGLESELRAENVRLVVQPDSPRTQSVGKLNAAIDQWTSERNARLGEEPYSSGELSRLLDFLVAGNRDAFEALARELDDEALYPGNASIGLGGKAGQPTIFLNSWKKGAPSRIHDHGRSKAAYHVFRGTLTERQYFRSRAGAYRLEEKTLEAGRTLEAVPPYIHQLENASADGSATVTINAYSPQLILMNRYKVGDGRIRFNDQWLDDDVVHQTSFSRGAAGLSIELEKEALDDWRKDERRFPGYVKNAVAMTLLFTLLQDLSVNRLDLIKKGYSLEGLNRLYLDAKLDSDRIFSILQAAIRTAPSEVRESGELRRLDKFTRAEKAAAAPALETREVPVAVLGARLAGLPNGPEELTLESRTIPSPWSRVTKGLGLGQYPVDYDAATADGIRAVVTELDASVPAGNAYNRFSNLLTRFVLDAADPAARPARAELAARTDELVAALAKVTDPSRYVTLSAILFESFAKLGLGESLLVNADRDLVRTAFETAARIQPQADDVIGTYDKLQAYTSLFWSVAQLGLKERVTEHVPAALALIDGVPTGHNRGRGAAMLFSVLKAMGYEAAIFADGRDRVKELLDFIDDDGRLGTGKIPGSREFLKLFALNVTLNAVALLGRREYLTYGRDRLAEAAELNAALNPEERAIQGEFYLLALYQLGELPKTVKDVEAYLRESARRVAEDIDSSKRPMAFVIANYYIQETAMMFGVRDILPASTQERLAGVLRSFPSSEKDAMWGSSLGFGSSYLVTMAVQTGRPQTVLAPNPSFDGAAPLIWAVRNFSPGTQTEEGTLRYLNHALVGAALRLRGADRPAAVPDSARLRGPQDLSMESRVISSPWSRMVRGMGLGQYPLNYDPAIAENLRGLFTVLDEKVPEANAYNRFSKNLTRLILDIEDPAVKLSGPQLKVRIDQVLADLYAEASSYKFVMGAGILMDTVAKLGLEPSLLVNAERDLVADSLKRASEIPPNTNGIHGAYERLCAYTGLFLGITQIGMKDRLVTAEKDYVAESLALLEQVPAPFYRGRGAAMYISVLKLLGFEGYLFADGRDRVKEVFDYLDRADQTNIWPTPPYPLTRPFFKVYPLLTMLNAAAVLGRAEYASYAKDRIAEAQTYLSQIAPEERTHMDQYFLVALYNLGLLDRVIPDLDGYLRQYASLLDRVNPAANWFPASVTYPYVLETLWMFGRSDLITERMVERMVNFLPGLKTPKDAKNRANPASYALNALGEMGLSERMFRPSAAYEGQPPLHWIVRQFSENAKLEESLYFLDHSAISLALRM